MIYVEAYFLATENDEPVNTKSNDIKMINEVTSSDADDSSTNNDAQKDGSIVDDEETQEIKNLKEKQEKELKELKEIERLKAKQAKEMEDLKNELSKKD